MEAERDAAIMKASAVEARIIGAKAQIAGLEEDNERLASEVADQRQRLEARAPSPLPPQNDRRSLHPNNNTTAASFAADSVTLARILNATADGAEVSRLQPRPGRCRSH